MKDCASVSEAVSVPLCPLRGAPMQPALRVPVDWRRLDDRREWQIWRNDTSEFAQVHPRPAPEDIAEFYDIDGYYTHAEREAVDPTTEARQVGVLGHFLGSLAYRFERGSEPTQEWWRSILPQGARNALEIGCGDGDRLLTLKPLVQTVRGVEPDPRAVRVARSRALDVHEGTAESLAPAITDRSYDLIAFVHVLEHTLDPVQSLKNARNLLAKGGILSIEVPNNACEGAQRMREAWRWLDAPRHLNFFTARSLQECAEAAGLRVKAVLYRGYVRQFMPDWIVDEARIRARLQRRAVTQADIDAQVRHSARLLAATALAEPARKYDSVRILCSA